MNYPYKKHQLKQFRHDVEAAILQSKAEEKDASPSDQQALTNYRKNTMRPAARCLNLAHTFLRGKPLRFTECNILEPKHPSNIRHLAKWQRPQWDGVWAVIRLYSYAEEGEEASGLYRAFERWLWAADLPSTVAPRISYNI